MMRIVRDLPLPTPAQRRRARVWNVAWLLLMAALLVACWYVYHR